MTLPLLNSTTVNKNTSTREPSKTEDLIPRMLAGGGVGLFADGVTNLALVIQTRRFASNAAKMSSDGWLSTAVKVITKEGLRGCYAGFPVIAAGSVMGTGAYCVGSHLTREYFGGTDTANFLSGYGGQISGSLCGWTTSSVLSEIQQAPHKLKNQKFADKKAREIALEILKNDGPVALYRGFWIQLVNFGAINGIGELLAGGLRTRLNNKEGNTKQLPISLQAAINGLSWGTAAATTTPFGVFKLRVQLSGMDSANFPDRSALQCALRVLKNEGIRGLYSGTIARVWAITPRATMFFTGMPYVYNYLRTKI